MTFEIELDRTYPHPRETLWRALTDRQLLARWLMENDFSPEPGAAFRLICEGRPDGVEAIACRVLDYEPPERMVWSWAHDGETAMRVEFTLSEVAGGTRLTIRHTGEADRGVVEGYEGGWPGKLDALEAALSARAGA